MNTLKFWSANSDVVALLSYTNKKLKTIQKWMI